MPKGLNLQVIAAKYKYKNIDAKKIKLLTNLKPCPDTIRQIYKGTYLQTKQVEYLKVKLIPFQNKSLRLLLKSIFSKYI